MLEVFGQGVARLLDVHPDQETNILVRAFQTFSGAGTYK